MIVAKLYFWQKIPDCKEAKSDHPAQQPLGCAKYACANSHGGQSYGRVVFSYRKVGGANSLVV